MRFQGRLDSFVAFATKEWRRPGVGPNEMADGWRKALDLPDWARRGREGWNHTGRKRPAFAIEPAEGQESVWDYPRPPLLVTDSREVVIRLEGEEIARSRSTRRVLETASAPTFYIPRADVDGERLRPAAGGSRCEWKGQAEYFDVVVPTRAVAQAAWSYPEPFDDFAEIRGHVAFYPHDLECTVDGTRVTPQPGRFYAGWITPEIVGPFKGEAGTEGW